MDRSQLIQSTSILQALSGPSLAEYASKRDSLIAQMNTLMLSRPDIQELVGESNIEMMKDNHANHARFMESIFTNFNGDVLADTILWVFRAYRSRNFTTAYWAAQLNTWITLYRQHLSEKCFQEIYPFYNWMQVHIPVFVALSDEKLEGNFSLH